MGNIILVDKIKERESKKQPENVVSDEINIPNHSGMLDAGKVHRTPTDDLDPVNKKYVDDNVGGVHTASSTDSLTNKTIDSFTNQNEADEIHIQIRNESGSIMTKGQLVYISGYNVGLDRTLVSLADANDSGTFPVLAMINDDDIANNADGHATVFGRVFDIDTSAFSAGDTAYLSDTPGALGTKPTGTSQVQAVGIVLRSQANNGVIELIGAGRVNDLPNIANTKMWIGDTNGVPQQFAMSGDAVMTAGGVVTIDHVDINNIGTNSHAQIDTHLADNTQAHSDYLLNSTADVGVGLTLTSDNNTGDTQYTAQVLHGTDATPPTASNFPRGTIYIQYTA